jgi:hypothetical protein
VVRAGRVEQIAQGAVIVHDQDQGDGRRHHSGGLMIRVIPYRGSGGHARLGPPVGVGPELPRVMVFCAPSDTMLNS